MIKKNKDTEWIEDRSTGRKGTKKKGLSHRRVQPARQPSSHEAPKLRLNTYRDISSIWDEMMLSFLAGHNNSVDRHFRLTRNDFFYFFFVNNASIFPAISTRIRIEFWQHHSNSRLNCNTVFPTTNLLRITPVFSILPPRYTSRAYYFFSFCYECVPSREY